MTLPDSFRAVAGPATARLSSVTTASDRSLPRSMAVTDAAKRSKRALPYLSMHGSTAKVNVAYGILSRSNMKALSSPKLTDMAASVFRASSSYFRAISCGTNARISVTPIPPLLTFRSFRISPSVKSASTLKSTLKRSTPRVKSFSAIRLASSGFQTMSPSSVSGRCARL